VPVLGLVLDLEAPTLALVFCRTRHEVDSLAESLSGRGYRVEALHGGLNQIQRDRVMKRARGGTVDVLVATDVAARGLDIEHITHVINFDVPESPQTYIHRIGRTGRAGREGVAITFAEPREHRLLRSIELLTKQKITATPLPTVHDIKAKRLEITRADIRETIAAGGLDKYRVVVETLAEEFDVMDIAAAAVQLAHQAEAGEEPVEIPPAPSPREKREKPAGRSEKAERSEKSGRPAKKPAVRGPKMVKVFIGSGKTSNMRPADLVGAIANEAGIEAHSIGTIEIAEKYSLVELPDDLVDDVVAALRATTIKGKRQTVRRDAARRA